MYIIESMLSERLIQRRSRLFALLWHGPLELYFSMSIEAKLGDVYVNDAFGTAHRAPSSTVFTLMVRAKCLGTQQHAGWRFPYSSGRFSDGHLSQLSYIVAFKLVLNHFSSRWAEAKSWHPLARFWINRAAQCWEFLVVPRQGLRRFAHRLLGKWQDPADQEHAG